MAKRKLFKKLTPILLVAVMLLAVFVNTGCTYWVSDYQWSEDSFYFSIAADRQYTRVGEEVEMTATFKNLSGHNLLTTVRILTWQRNAELEDILNFGDAIFPWIRHDRVLRIPANATVSKTWATSTFYYFDCYNQRQVYNIFSGWAVFYIGLPSNGDWYYKRTDNTVFLHQSTTLNIINGDITYSQTD